ncbi:MAG TPA: hypothetical protein VGN61_09455 [Verrucomicrobiae bacterium]|jgi:hypothetical protein
MPPENQEPQKEAAKTPPPIVPTTGQSKPRARKTDWICTQCNYIGSLRSETQGSLIIEIALWFLCLLPGLIYSVWRLTTRRRVCPVCHSPSVIPARSPRGMQIVDIEP